MKTKYFLLGFFIFSMISVGTLVQVRASDFDLGVDVDDTRTWEVVTADSSNEMYGKEGSEYKIVINSIMVINDDWILGTTETIDGEESDVFKIVPGNETWQGSGHVNQFICAIDIEEWLELAYYGMGGVTIDGSSYTMEAGANKLEVSYDAKTGWMNTYKFTNNSIVVLFLRSTSGGGEENLDIDLIFLIVVIGIISVIIITPTTLLILKRKKSISRSGFANKDSKSGANKPYNSIHSSISSENPYAQAGQLGPPLKSGKFSVYCASCHAPGSITKERFYHFTCKECGHYFFNMGYFCKNCNIIYPFSRDEFLNLQEPETLLCYECNNVMELVRSDK